MKKAIKELEDLEHFSHYTAGLSVHHRHDLFEHQIDNELMWEINFWEEVKKAKLHKFVKGFAPYIDFTKNPSESYLIFCEHGAPWDEKEENRIRVFSNKESHKMLNILEKHFGIKNRYK